MYKEEHITCAHYDSDEKPLIEVREISNGQSFGRRLHECAIVFVLEGSATYKLKEAVVSELDKGQIVLIASDQPFGIDTNDSAKLLIIYLMIQEVTTLCNCFPIEKLLDFKKEEEPADITVLAVNATLNSFVTGLAENIEHGLRCKYYLEIKTKELFYLLRAYYAKEQLAQFLREILYTNVHFEYVVKKSYRGINCVGEFAKLMGMRQLSFERKFREVFGVPPYKWIIEQKIKDIHHAVCTTHVPLQELAVRFGFSSKSSFSDFCKKNLGMPPGKIRKNAWEDMGSGLEQNSV